MTRGTLVPFLSVYTVVRYFAWANNSTLNEKKQLRNRNVVVKFDGLWFITQGCVTAAFTTFVVLLVIQFSFGEYVIWNCRFLAVGIRIQEIFIHVCFYIM
jgi:hypothetical protein